MQSQIFCPRLILSLTVIHIMAHVNKAINSLRREQQRSLDDNDKKALKGCRFLLLRNYHSFGSDFQVKLDKLLDINQPLFVMHSMKEQLRLLWSQVGHKPALALLNQWYFDALMSEIKPLVKVGLTLIKHKKGILNYFYHQLTSGSVEGVRLTK